MTHTAPRRSAGCTTVDIIQRELSDGSEVYSVILFDTHGDHITLDAIDLKSALALSAALSEALNKHTCDFSEFLPNTFNRCQV